MALQRQAKADTQARVAPASLTILKLSERFSPSLVVSGATEDARRSGWFGILTRRDGTRYSNYKAMDNLTEFLGSVASKLKTGLGLKPSDLAQLQDWSRRCEQAVRDNQDKWESMKNEIRKIELRLRKKKQEMDDSHGLVRRMVEEEIEKLFAQLDRKETQIRLLRRNSDTLEITLDKIREVEHATDKSMSEHDLDMLAVKLEEAFEELTQVDSALSGLRTVDYPSPERPASDVSARLSRLDEPEEKRPVGLSSRTADRLKQLEKEMDGTAE